MVGFEIPMSDAHEEIEVPDEVASDFTSFLFPDIHSVFVVEDFPKLADESTAERHISGSRSWVPSVQ
jgi:hypothetical protein